MSLVIPLEDAFPATCGRGLLGSQNSHGVVAHSTFPEDHRWLVCIYPTPPEANHICRKIDRRSGILFPQASLQAPTLTWSFQRTDTLCSHARICSWSLQSSFHRTDPRTTLQTENHSPCYKARPIETAYRCLGQLLCFFSYSLPYLAKLWTLNVIKLSASLLYISYIILCDL